MAVTSCYFTEFGKPVFQKLSMSICSGMYARVHCILYCMYAVVVKKIHLCYFISWWVSCNSSSGSHETLCRDYHIKQLIRMVNFSASCLDIEKTIKPTMMMNTKWLNASRILSLLLDGHLFSSFIIGLLLLTSRNAGFFLIVIRNKSICSTRVRNPTKSDRQCQCHVARS